MKLVITSQNNMTIFFFSFIFRTRLVVHCEITLGLLYANLFGF